MRHHPKHVTLPVSNSGNMVQGSVWVFPAVAKDDPLLRLKVPERQFVAGVMAFSVSNRQADDFSLMVTRGEKSFVINHFQSGIGADEVESGIGPERSREQAAFCEDLEAVADTEYMLCLLYTSDAADE